MYKKIFITLLFIFSFISHGTLIKASLIDEEKVYCTATINDSFSDNQVCIILSNKETLKLKTYTVDDFLTDEIKNIGISSIEELTDESTKVLINQINGNYESDYNKIDTNKYKRIFSISLANPSKENVLEVINKLEDDVKYDYVGVNYISEFELTSYNNELSVHNNSVNNFDLANLSNSWSITTGSNDVLVGILDTGIWNLHPDLIDNVNVELSKDFTDTNNPFLDTYGHGTHVAGIIGANGVLNGISPNVSMVSLKVMGGNNSSNDNNVNVMSSRLIDAISYATEKGIKILNFSAGRYDGTYNQLEKQAIDNFNGIFIQAAGNMPNDIDQNNMNYPSCYDCDNMIVVAGLDYNGNVAIDPSHSTWENGGTSFGAASVDLFAPGTYVYTTETNNRQDIYTHDTGTSVATPFVTGTCALLLSFYPELSYNELKYIIMSTATYDNRYVGKCVTGGRLNIYNAITLDMLEGTGTAQSPYLIDCVEKFNLIKHLDGTNIYFKQTSNIDFNYKKHNLHTYTFKGSYDGNNCYLNNIMYTTTNILDNQYIGGFAAVNQGTIKNIKFNNLNIEIFNPGDTIISVGGVVGVNNKYIQNINIKYGIITTDENTINTGGICGDNVYSGIENNIMNCTIEYSYINGYGHTGGICGQNEDGIIYSCTLVNTSVSYSQQSTINKSCGGIIGLNKDKVMYCSIDSNSTVEYFGSSTINLIKPRIGKIVGENWSGQSNIINCLSTGTIISGNLNANYNQLDCVGAFYNGMVGLEQGE